MYTLATAALAVALGISLSAIPAMSADDNKTLKDKAVDAKDTVKEKTSEAWDKTKETTSEAWDKAKEKTSEAWDKTREKTVEAKDKIKAKVSGDKKESAEDKAEATREKADGKDTVGAKVDRGVEKTKAKARETKDKIAAQTESSADIRQAQMALKDKGHAPGPIDGIHGPRTSAALSRLPEGREHQGDRPARRRHQVAPDGPGLERRDGAVGLAGRREALRGAVCGRLTVGGPGSTVEDRKALTRHRGARRASAGPA